MEHQKLWIRWRRIKAPPIGDDEQIPTTLYIINGSAAPIIDNDKGKANITTAGATDVASNLLLEVVGSRGAANQDGKAAEQAVSLNKKKARYWRRMEREETEVQSSNNNSSMPLFLGDGKASGKVHPRAKDEDDEMDVAPAPKRSIIQVPSLSECLGKEGLRTLREAKQKEIHMGKDNDDTEDRGMGEQNSIRDGKEEVAATGPGATGKLSGTDESARQGP
jgi:hypothetical protein